jgi:hypothetical protein
MQTIKKMIFALESNKDVLGLIEYGGLHKHDDFLTGDYDLFVILKSKDSDVESLHFYITNIPVDLNIGTLEEIKKLKFAKGFETALLEGRIIYDPTGKIETELQKLIQRHKQNKPKGMTEHAIAFSRHGHKHVFDKIKGCIEEMPLLCRLLLNANIYWLIETYFNVRNLQFKGEKRAIAYLEKNEPKIFRAIEDFYSAESLIEQVKISKKLTELVLSPVGGAWKDDKVLAFGEGTKDLQKKGRELFQKLFLPK